MNEFELDQALRSLSQQYPAMPGAQEVEARLLAAFDARKNRRPRNLWMPSIALAMAASIAAIGFVSDVRSRPAVRAKEVFIAIPYTIPPAPYERTTVVRMNVEVAALRAAGFDVQAINDGSVPADVLFAQDGRAVAIHTLTVPIL